MRRQDAAFRRGVDELSRGRFRRARAWLLRALAGGGPDTPWACQELVQTYLRLGAASEAEDGLRAALPAGSILLDHALGYAWRRLGRAAEAREMLERAWARPDRTWATATELPFLRFVGGDEAAALRLLAEAERHFTGEDDAWGLAATLAQRATIAMLRFRMDEALRLFERAIPLREACGDGAGLANVLTNVASVRWTCSDQPRAREAYGRALELHRRAGSAEGTTATLIGLAICELDAGAPEQARELLASALRAVRRLRPAIRQQHEAVIHLNLGDAARRMGRPQAALRHLRAALRIAPPEEDVESSGFTTCGLAESLVELGRPRQALAVLDDWRRRRRTAPGARCEAGILVEEARARLSLGDLAGCRLAARSATALARRIPGPQRRLFVQALTARTLEARADVRAGRSAAAGRVLAGVVRDVDRLVDDMPSTALRVGVADAFRLAGDALVEAAAEQGGARAAWAEAQAVKARELRMVLGAAAQERARAADDEAALAAAAAEGEYRDLVVRDHLTRADLGRLEELRLRFTRARTASRDRARARPSTRAKAAGARRVAELLGHDTALLEYHVARDWAGVFVAHGGDVRLVRLELDERELERAVPALLAPLRLAASGADPFSALEGWDDEAALRLGTALVAPALDVLPRAPARLVIVPDGPLHDLPFELLRVEGSQATTWLDDAALVSYLPAWSLAVGGTAHAPRRYAGLAWSPRRSLTIGRAGRPMRLDALPQAAGEIRRAARLFPAGDAFVGADATLRSLQACARRAEVLHVASHAVADARAPGLSGIVLADGARTGDADFVTAERLARLRLAPGLVVLSACETAGGRLAHREGVLGLARAFLEAGAEAVVASRWAVDDAAARRLVSTFLRAVRAGSDRPAALAGARRDLRAAAEGGWRHPFYWAAWSLTDRRIPGSGR